MYTIWSPEHQLHDDSGNSHFSFHLVVWERYKAADAVRACKNSIHRYERKNKELIFWTYLPQQMTASLFINKNITARLHFLCKFLGDSGMPLSMHYVSRARHSMAGNAIGKQHLALHAEGLTFSFFKLQWINSIQMSSLHNSCPCYFILNLSRFLKCFYCQIFYIILVYDFIPLWRLLSWWEVMSCSLVGRCQHFGQICSTDVLMPVYWTV